MRETQNSSSPSPSVFGRGFPWIVALVVLVLDRYTKVLVLNNLEIGSWKALIPGVALTHVHNRGIAFSLFAEGGPFSRVILHAVILTAVVLIAWMLVRQPHQRLWAKLAFGLILGGAIGNLVDRILYGWVVDFIHIWVRTSTGSWSWPDFNIADSAITVGAVLLVITEMTSKEPKNEDVDAPDSD